MEKQAKGTKGIISANAFDGPTMKAFNGQRVVAGEHIGTSGETQEWQIPAGGCLFLTPNQVIVD